ncbi:MAG: reverse transcriptase domain-containing protein [Pseudomonadota bacterium]
MYFLVSKKGGGMRPILDLRGLNGYLKKFRFKMLTTSSLLSRVREGTWFTSVDLSDAFFHITVYPPHRKFLRFSLDGRVYQYTVLPFGLALSPRVFTKVTQAAVAPLRAMGIRLDTYLDDWLLSADSRHEAIEHTGMVVAHLARLGFILNHEKSSLVPSRRTTFLGVQLDSTTLQARLSPERIQTFRSCLAHFRPGTHVPYLLCMRLSGLMASTIHLMRLGRYHMRPFQRWVGSLRIPSSQRQRQVLVSAACAQALRPWRQAGLLSQGVKIGMISSLKVLTTDASLSGWGAILDGRSAKGTWNAAFRSKHINVLELLAVLLALKRFERSLVGRHVLVRTDNMTTMAYINRQGGLASPSLDALARELTLWCDSRLKSIRAVHLPGLQNHGADLLSRGRYYYDDWVLHPSVTTQIFARYGRPSVDLFASEANAKCSRFFSIQGTATMGLEALAHDWPRDLLYAFPPLRLIYPVLDRVRRQGLSVLLIAPRWGSWRSEITPLLYDIPWRLPPLSDLLSQAAGTILHPRPELLDLWVWPVRGPPSQLAD